MEIIDLNIKFTGVKKSIRFIVLLLALGVLNSHTSILKAEELHAHPASLVFNAVEGQAFAATRSIFIFSANGTSINWTEAKDASWLVPNSLNGSTSGVLKIGINTSGITAGTYTGHITLQSSQSTADPIIVTVTMIVNPNVPVTVTTWKDGFSGAMSVSVDDSQGSGFDALSANGFSGTYFFQGATVPSFYNAYYNAGMELGCHTIDHPCGSSTDAELRYQEIEPNIHDLITQTPEPAKDVINLAWPCGFTNYREQAVATDYFLSCRGYNWNQLEDPVPENFMNLKSFNSHEHTPYPPSDLKTVVDDAVNQKKWFNLVLHDYSNDDGATTYAHSKDIWVTAIGTITKYIIQRERFILTDYFADSQKMVFSVSRAPIPSSSWRTFEPAFGPNDLVTLQIDVDDTRTIGNVTIDGVPIGYTTKDLSGNKVILLNVRLDPSATKSIQVTYLTTGLTLRISGVTANNKVYNASTTATLNKGGATLVGVNTGDVVTLNTTTASGNFVNKNVGTSKTVITAGFTIGGADADKYVLIQPTTTANITYPSNVSISGVTADDKVYDGNTSTTLNSDGASLSGVMEGDIVTIIATGATGTFSNKKVGTGKSVSISGILLGGVDGRNYILTQPSSTANITRAELTISGVTADNKEYDGTTTATLNTGSASLDGIISGDVVNLNTTGATGTFADRNIGNNIDVSTSGFTIGGTDAGNYSLTQPTTTADITQIELTVSGVTANSRPYNSSTSATLNTGGASLVGVLGGDNVTLISTGATGSFSNKNTGSNKTVTISGFTLGGSDRARYTLTQPTATAAITRADITISGVTANNKVYNGTTLAILNTGSASLTGIFTGDDVSLVTSGASGNFADKNIGTGKAVTTTGFTLGGTDAGNYNLIQPESTASITKAELTISGVTANNKVYDGTTAASLNTGSALLVGIFGSDAVTLITTGATGTFADPNIGNGIVVSMSGFTIGGTNSGNYTLTQPATTANITGIVLTVTGVTANDKVYNATTSATLNAAGASLQGVLGLDNVTLISAGATGTFSNKNAGTLKPVTTSGFTLGGTDRNKYILTQPTATASITRANLAISGAVINSKVYDGTTLATLNTGGASLVTVFSGDAVNLITSGVTASFSDKNAGTGKTVLTAGFSIGGTDAINYNIIQPSLTGNVTPAGLTISGVTANSKIYDGTTSAAINTGSALLVGLFGGDNVTLNASGAAATFANKNSGTGKSVIISGFTLGGTNSGNYTLTQPTSTANITGLTLTVTGVTANNKLYDRTTTSTLKTGTASLAGVLSGDVVTLGTSAATGNFASRNIGSDKPVTTSGFLLGGTDAGNYTLIQPSTSATINKAELTVSGVTAKNKVYDGTTTATLDVAGAALSGIFGGDLVNLVTTGALGIFSDKNAGVAKTVLVSGFSITGTDAGNYTLAGLSLTAEISPKTFTVNVKNHTKVYGTSQTFTGSDFTTSGLVTNDDDPNIILSSMGASVLSPVGTYDINASGGSDNNYTYVYNAGKLTVNKAELIAAADNKSKVFNSENPELTISYAGFVNGDNSSVLDVLPTASTSATIDSQVGIYIISLAGGSDNNYNIHLVNGNLDIAKGILHITADNKTIVFGEPVPELTISYSGFVQGDDERVLSSLPTVETSANGLSDAGDYDIIVSGAEDPTYILMYNNGILHIAKADQQIVFDALPSRLRMTQKQVLNSTASSGLPVSYEISDPSKGDVNGNVLTIRRDGNFKITAIQGGDRNWNNAPDVTQSIVALPTFDGISSLFTPNNDGMNDYWYIPDLESYGKIQVNLYNRFGQIVYSSDAYKNDWNGTWDGYPLPSASYYYIIRSSEKGIIKGVVNIVR